MKPLLVFAVILFTACSAGEPAPAVDLNGLTFTVSSLTLNGVEVDVSASPPTMAFADGQVSGHNGCNSYFGVALIGSSGSFSMGSMGQTQMYCVETADLESAFNEAAVIVDTWVRDGNRLTLAGDGDATVIILTEDGPAAIN